MEEVILELVQEDYLNEERYARSYVRGKHRIKKWGRNKIIQELKSKGISQYCIKQGLTEIEYDHYIDSLNDVVSKYYNARIGLYDRPKLKIKTIQHGVSKGYEYQLVKGAIEKL